MRSFLYILLLCIFCTQARAELMRIRTADSHISLAVFDPKQSNFNIIDQGGLKEQAYQNLGKAMKEIGAFAGCNGGFFHPDGRALGALWIDGQKLQKMEKGSFLVSAAIGTINGMPFIKRAKHLTESEKKQCENLFQTGPFLVENEKLVDGLSTKKRAHRTFIASCSDGRWALGYAPSSTLNQLAKALLSKQLQEKLPISLAVNLDGGPSSGLWMADKKSGAIEYIREQAPVRTFIAILPKND